jgi:uncharacterized membrane protein
MITLQKPTRLASLDLARALAIVFMVQGHMLDALLAPEFRSGRAFDIWLFLRGLTAPMFLVLAGVSFTFASERTRAIRSRATEFPGRRVLRFLFFIALGYLMHLPARTLNELRMLDDTGLRAWLQVDVLQCLGATLLVLQLLLLVAKTPRIFGYVTFVAAVLVVSATPSFWTARWVAALPLSAAAYSNGTNGSLFPLFPWSAYVLAGSALASLQRHWIQSPRRLAVAGAVFAGMGVALDAMPVTIFNGADFWRTSPNLFLMKIGAVCVLLAGITALAQMWKSMPKTAVARLSRESLIVYLGHLAIVYGSAWNPGLRHFVGPSLTLVVTLAWTSILLCVMITVAIAWHACKRALLYPIGSELRDRGFELGARLRPSEE